MKKSKLFGTIAIGLLGIGASASAIGLLSTSCSQNNSATEDSSSDVANNDTLNNTVKSIYNSVNDEVFAPIKNEPLAEKGPKLVPTSLKEKNEDQIRKIINKEFNSKFFGDGSDYVDSINFEINRYNNSVTVVVKLNDTYKIKTTTINDNIVISDNNNSFSLTYGDMGIGNYVTKDDLNTLYDCANKFLSDTYNNNKLAMSTDNILEPWKETGFQMLKDAGFNTNLLSVKTSPFTITYETNTINASITLQQSSESEPIVYANDVPGVIPDKPQGPDENGNPQTDSQNGDGQAEQGDVVQGDDSAGNKEPTTPTPSLRDATTENGDVGNDAGQNGSPTNPVEPEQPQQEPEQKPGANNDPYNFSIAENVGTMTFDPTKTVGDNSVDYNFDSFLDSQRLINIVTCIDGVFRDFVSKNSAQQVMEEIANNNVLPNGNSFSATVWKRFVKTDPNFVANSEYKDDYNKWPQIVISNVSFPTTPKNFCFYNFKTVLTEVVCTAKTNDDSEITIESNMKPTIISGAEMGFQILK